MNELPLNQILCGDCIELLQGFPDNSIDLVATDPQYGLGFMGLDWDQALPSKASFKEICRVLKPGALAFVMSSPRQDLMARMILLLEDAGFRTDLSFIEWIYKTGFPKAYDVSKGIDKKWKKNQEIIEISIYLKKKRLEKGLTTIELAEFFKTHPDRVNHGGCVSNWENGVNLPTSQQYEILKSKLDLDDRFDNLISENRNKWLEAKREVIGIKHNERNMPLPTMYDNNRVDLEITTPSLEEAKRWGGWKSQTGLKPAQEPVLMVYKPRSESTIVDNVLRWGTGAINVDATRIPFKGQEDEEGSKVGFTYFGARNSLELSTHEDYPQTEYNPEEGRFPANLLVSDRALDTGELSKSPSTYLRNSTSENVNSYGKGIGEKSGTSSLNYGDQGDQSRYFDLDAWAQHHGFLDVPKPDTSERDYGLKGRKQEVYRAGHGNKETDPVTERFRTLSRNTHPTVKPIKLMAYLIELGCPRNGVVLDPFVGSGTTCIAAKQLGRKYIGIEIKPEYHVLAEARVAAYPQPLEWFQESQDVH